MENQRLSLWTKIWRSLASLGLLFTLISPTEFSFSLTVWGALIIVFVFFAGYWHMVEYLTTSYRCVINYFKDIRDDIKFIRKNIEHKGDDNE